MKNSIFVDTVAWIALVNKSEDLHNSALVVRDKLIEQKTRLITTDFVVVEIANSLARPPLRSVAHKLIDFIQASESIELITITPELFKKAYLLYCTRTDKDWGLTDCTSFVVMQTMGISRAFTADRHFEQAGFPIVLK